MTTWAKNEVVALKRQCTLLVYKDGAPCPRGTDLMATGFVYFRGANSPNADPAVGTMTNQRRELILADDVVESVDTTANTLQLTGHLAEAGDGPLFLTSTGLVPGGYPIGTGFYAIVSDANHIQMAATPADAYAGTAIDILSTGSGTITLQDGPTTQRGIDGRFVYQATQTETNHDGVECEVFVDSGKSGTSYALADGNGGGAVVSMAPAVKGFETVLEGGHTGEDLARLWTAVLAGPVLDFSNGVLAFKSLDGTKTRLTVTTGPTGRLSIVLGDLT